MQSGDNDKVAIVYDENFKLKQLRRFPITLGCLQAITEIPAVDCESKIDVRFQLQTMRAIAGPHMELYAKYTDVKSVLQVMPGHEQSEMPPLRICEGYRGQIQFIRQKKVESFAYSRTARQENCDHFTVHVKVDVNRVREYQKFDQRTGTPARVDEYTDVNVVLPTVPPLHYKEDHRELIHKLVDFSMKIRDVIRK